MAYLNLNGIAKEIDRFVEDKIREQLARIQGIRGISRISTFDADGSVKRWRKPTAVDVGKLVRVSQDPVGDPRVLQLGTLEWAGDGGFDHPFSVRVNNESYVKAYRYAWIEVEARQEAPREPAPAAASDTIEAHGWLWRKATENDVGKEAYFCFFNTAHEPNVPPDEIRLRIAAYSEGYFISSAENGWKARLAWIPAKQLESKPESEPEAISITPEPEHPEPVEVIKAPASDPNLTIYLHQGKAYRLANSSDIGKHVLVSDDALTHAVTEEAEMLLEIFEDAPLPYETTSAYWKLAFIEDPSLTLDEPARGGEIKTDEQLQEALAELPPGSKLWLPGPEIAEAKPEAEKWIHDGKRYRRATAGDIGKECWVSETGFERAMQIGTGTLTRYIEDSEYPFVRVYCEWKLAWVLDEDQEINASEMVCEVVPAPDGSTTDPELPPLPEVEDEEPEAPAEPEWITPRPEHVGQMVEVRQFQGGEPWKERQLLAILPETQGSRYICKSSAISSHQNRWVYARVRKAQQ